MSKKNKGVTFDKSENKDPTIPSKSPPPGSYNTDGAYKYLLSNKQKGVTIGRKFPEPTKSQSPAPDTYDVERAEQFLRSKFYKGGLIGEKIYEKPKNDSPSPGHYDVERSDNYLKTRIPMVVFQ